MEKKNYVSDDEKLMRQWDWEANSAAGYSPETTTKGSTKKVFWKCEKGHVWQASPNNRSKGQGCPICAGRQVLAGYNDLLTCNPDIAAEWHPTKNSPLTPQAVTAHSHKNIWWKCAQCGHEWETSVSNRSAGKGCPICSLKKQGQTKVLNLIKASGSFADKYPELLAEWDYDKNVMSPSTITPNSSTKVWWKCSVCGYTWRTSVSHRTIRRSGCPACKNKVATNTNSVKSVRPDLLNYWDYEKNIDISVDNRRRGNGCPICSGHQLLIGYNDLATTHPQLCQEWDPTKNGDLTPQKITKGSHKKVWWICPKGHEYSATVSNRVLGRGCPICSLEKRSAARNRNRILRQGSLAQTHPDLAAEWNYELNGDLRPDDVTKGSSRKVWWTCPKGHTYQSTIANRVSGRKCPVCAGKKIIDGVNDLAIVCLSFWASPPEGRLHPFI